MFLEKGREPEINRETVADNVKAATFADFSPTIDISTVIIIIIIILIIYFTH